MSTVEKDLVCSVGNELTYAHMLHQIFFHLFDAGEDVKQLLIDSDEQFFSIIREIFLDAIALSFTRLLDPERSCGKDNLSLFYLFEQPSLCSHPDHGKWRIELDQIRQKANPFGVVRNKVAAHLDLSDTKNRGIVGRPSFSRPNIEEVYGRIADWLNLVRAGLGMPYFDYKIGVSGFRYAKPLLLTLAKARKTQNPIPLRTVQSPAPSGNTGNPYS
jgi:hypothetical protein